MLDAPPFFSSRFNNGNNDDSNALNYLIELFQFTLPSVALPFTGPLEYYLMESLSSYFTPPKYVDAQGDYRFKVSLIHFPYCLIYSHLTEFKFFGFFPKTNHQ